VVEQSEEAVCICTNTADETSINPPVVTHWKTLQSAMFMCITLLVKICPSFTAFCLSSCIRYARGKRSGTPSDLLIAAAGTSRLVLELHAWAHEAHAMFQDFWFIKPP
jgi:hypothetical protein